MTVKGSGTFGRLACAAVLCAVGLSLNAKTIQDYPVSVTNNALYLTSMTQRLWWNEAWTKRLPLLVATESDVEDEKVVVDTVVDFGEPVKPEDVRVVTPWETLVDCVAEKVEVEGGGGQRCVRLLFKTSLRPQENKPFLVYYARQGEEALAAKPGDLPSPSASLPDVQLATTDESFRIRNGVLDVVFDRRQAADGLIRSLRILGSSCKTVLFDRANGYPRLGFVLRQGSGKWDAGEVVLDTPIAKSVRFNSKDISITFTLYADQPRVDWAYRFNNWWTGGAFIEVDWCLGKDSAYDDLFYCGKAGKILTTRAGLDCNSDCVRPPETDLKDWLGEGWFAIGERRMSDIAGLVFDHRAVKHLHVSGYHGVTSELALEHKTGQTKEGFGGASGAIVATMGDANDFRRIYKRIAKPLAVSVGVPQAKVSKPYRIPRLDRDWCCDYCVGWIYGGDNSTGCPIPKDSTWADSIAERMRALGSTTVCLLGYPWWQMPIRDKALYDRLADIQTHKGFEAWVAKKEKPTWEQMAGRGEHLLAFTKALHAKGLGVNSWNDAIPGWSQDVDGHFSKEINDLSIDLAVVRADAGQDCAQSVASIQGEGIALPTALRAKHNGSCQYYTWEDPTEAFAAFDSQHADIRDFYTKFKAKKPDVPVFLWNSEDGSYDYEKFMSDDEGFFDTCIAEWHTIGSGNFPRIKYFAKRLRSHFNNRVGHTVWHHYYNMVADAERRIHHIESPFICGVNGFSQESIEYEAKMREALESTADFFRFMEYTRLGEKVAKMGPVKNLGVYRDPKAYRADIYAKRLNKPWQGLARIDGRCCSFAKIPCFNYDVIGPKYFTAKNLAQYKVVYIPEDEMLSEAEAKEALAFVENGGSLVVEGAMDAKFKTALQLQFDTPTPYGKGKILWYKDPRTDRIAAGDKDVIAKVRADLAALGGVEPWTISALNGQACPFSGLDGNLQAGPDGMFLGLYNSAKETQNGKVTLHCPPPPSTSTSLFALDVKRGTCVPITNNTFIVSCEPGQCAFYLIGDDAFTSVPAVKACASLGPSAVAKRANVRMPNHPDVTGFKPATVVEFVRMNPSGKPYRISRSAEAKLDVRAFTPKTFDAKEFKVALAETKLLHVAWVWPEDTDVVFGECGDALKDFLKRGGTIMFTGGGTGKNAKAFLDEVGVFNPHLHAKSGVGDTWASWCGPEDHPLLTCDLIIPTKKPRDDDWGPAANYRGFRNFYQYTSVFSKWDAAKQQVLFKPKVDGESYAAFVMQEKVLGAGRVIFNQNTRSFTDYYEAKAYSHNFLAWTLGIKLGEHADKVTVLNGGPGDVWRDREGGEMLDR